MRDREVLDKGLLLKWDAHKPSVTFREIPSEVDMLGSSSAIQGHLSMMILQE